MNQGAGKKQRRIAGVLAAILIGLWGLPVAGINESGSAYGAEFHMKVEKSGGNTGAPGDEDIPLNFTITNEVQVVYMVTNVRLEGLESGTIRVSGGTTGATELGHKESMNANFKIGVRKSATRGEHYYTLVADIDGQATELGSYVFKVEERLAYNGAVDFTHKTTPEEGFAPGSDNSITFDAFNKGNTTIRNAEFNITLPDGMWVNNESNVINVGYMAVGETKTRTYPITVDETLGGKTYPITIKITGVDMAGENVNVEKTFYIPVSGDGGSTAKNLTIQNISLPSEVTVDETFMLTFLIKNEGKGTVKNAKISAELPEDILNKTTAVFVLDSLAAGQSKEYQVALSARKASGTSYPIKISAEPLDASDGVGTAQYASVFVTGNTDAAKTPQLMIDQYNYGGSSVMAGKEFYLDLSVYNTSAKKLSNIKVTVSSDDGTFVPVGSSNAFFIESIEAKGSYARSLHLSAKPNAEQKTTALKVSMAYEDGEGNSFTAEDTVSIPVEQQMRLRVDDIVPPYECYIGQPGASQVQFFNMGKTTLNNLTVKAEGDFDIMESNSYYVGNMEGGKSDSYSFTFIPRQEGPMEGKIVFTYEDINGNPIVYEAPFTFQVAAEMPVWEDPNMDMEPEAKTPWMLIIFGIVAVLLVTGIFVGQKIRKAKINKKLEIQDAAFNAALDLDQEMEEDRS